MSEKNPSIGEKPTESFKANDGKSAKLFYRNGVLMFVDGLGNEYATELSDVVQTFNGRSGVVTPAVDDYAATQIDNDSAVSGEQVSDALEWLNTNKSGTAHTHAGMSHTILGDIGTNTHAQIDTHIADATKHRQINDSSTSATELWSANKIDASLALKVATSSVGANSGVAGLDGSGKVPYAQLPEALLGAVHYEGTWDASDNDPFLTDATGTQGAYYRCTVAGSVDFGSGAITFTAGDWVIHDGDIWEKVDVISSAALTVGATPIGSGTNGRILFQSGGVVSQDADLTFVTDTLTATKLSVTTAIVDRVNINQTGAALYIYDDDGTTLRAWCNTGVWQAAAFVGSDDGQYIGNYGGYAAGVILGSNRGYYFSSTGAYYGTKDLGIERVAANVAKITDGSTGLGSLTALRFQQSWLIKTTTYTASSFERIQANTAAGAWTLTLPPSPTAGDSILIEDAALTWGTNNLTLDRNGLKINSGTSNYTANVIGGKLSCVYLDVTIGWSIK